MVSYTLCLSFNFFKVLVENKNSLSITEFVILHFLFCLVSVLRNFKTTPHTYNAKKYLDYT